MNKKNILLIAVFIYMTFLPSKVNAQVDPDLDQRLQNGPIIVDWDDVSLFDQIPQVYIDRATNIHMLFSDRSVGQNIHEGLDCLITPSSQAVSACKRNHYDTRYTVDPSELVWNGTHNRSNWAFEFRGGSWDSLTQDFVEGLIPTYIGTNDIVTYQFSYLNVDEGDSISDPVCGFLATGDRSSCSFLANWHVGRIEELEAQYPNKVFFYWTSSLARGIGTSVSDTFNNQMRTWAQNNNKILFDVASILSHTPSGQPCYDNRDGVEYCNINGTTCENYPDDGANRLAICPHYTTELDGGHLGSASAGKIRVAKAYWVLMAQIAGWEPGGVTPTSSPTPSISPTSTPTNTPTLAPTPVPGDTNGDGMVDGVDYVTWLINYDRSTPNGAVDADFDLSGFVDGVDYIIWLTNYTG